MKRLFALLLLIGLVSIATATPSYTTGLIIELNADSLALNNGDSVTTWADSWATGADGTLNALGTYGTPVYSTNAINGHSAVYFDATQTDGLYSADWTWTQNTTNSSNGLTMFVVATGGAGSAATDMRVVQVGNKTGSSKTVAYDIMADQSGGRYNNGASLANNAFEPGEWVVGTLKMAQGGTHSSLYYAVNGEQQTVSGSTTLTMAFTTGSNRITVGSGFDATKDGHSPFTGYVAEVLVYNRQLTATQIAGVNDYLMTKYAIPEPATLILLGLGSLIAVRCRRA